LGKGIPTDKQIEQFTVGNDRELDLVFKYDALAHPCKKCWPIGLLTTAETESLVAALEEIIVDVEKEIS
jgi:argininosuccinate lyase